MSHVGGGSRRKARKQARPLVGLAGTMSLLLGGGASAGATGMTADIPSRDVASHQQITLSEEEINDVSLSTFYVFDREDVRKLRALEKVAHCRGCGGCRSCGGCRGGYCRR